MGSSHQTQGGKSGANPVLSRSCEPILDWGVLSPQTKIQNRVSQNARRVVNPLHNHLRGTDDANFKLLQLAFYRNFKVVAF
jgi:hypothetical protein